MAGTIYIDHNTQFCCIYMIRNASSDETLQSKLAFEQFAKENDVHIKHYHATMANLATWLSSPTVSSKANVSPIVESILTSKMGLPNELFVILVMLVKNNFYMQWHDRWTKTMDLAMKPYALH